MFEEAKQSDGFVDQKKFKTADNYSSIHLRELSFFSSRGGGAVETG